MNELLVKAFWDRVHSAPQGDCLIWKGYRNKRGYGYITMDGKPLYAHRIAWEMEHGAIPKGMYVLHRCDEPSCVNVNHLFLGTQANNMADMVSKGRQSKGVLHGIKRRGELNGKSKFTEEQILAMLALRKAGETQDSVARQFGTNQGYISDIENGKVWGWLTGLS